MNPLAKPRPPLRAFQLKPEGMAYSSLIIKVTDMCGCGEPIALLDDRGEREWRHENGRAQCGAGRGWAYPRDN